MITIVIIAINSLGFISGVNASNCTKLNLGVSANGTNGGGTTTYLTETKFSFKDVDNPVNGDSGKQQKLVRCLYCIN